MSDVPVFGWTYRDGGSAMRAFAGAFHRYIEGSALDVSFVRAQLKGEWCVFALGESAKPDMLEDGFPCQVPEVVGEMLNERRRQWAQVSREVVLHHSPPLQLRSHPQGTK